MFPHSSTQCNVESALKQVLGASQPTRAAFG
jgi:hypothetical protein